MKHNLIIFCLSVLFIQVFSQDVTYKNAEFPIEQRVENLVRQMTWEEKLA